MDYQQLVKNHPELFQNDSGMLKIIADPEEIARWQADMRKELLEAGKPLSWAEIGVVFQDRFITPLRDLIEFESGIRGGYNRLVNSANLQGGIATVILPVFEEKIIPLNQFRHTTRQFHYEIPRGYGEPGLTAEACARKEIQEELNVTDFEMVELLREPEGPNGGTVYFLAKLSPTTPIRPERAEGIASFVWVDEKKLEEWISSGEFGDLFSLRAYLLAKLYDRNNPGALN